MMLLHCVVTDTGYGHIAPKTALGRVATIIYATFGIPLTLLTIAQVGRYMAAVFRFTYKNVVCGLGGGVCSCCRHSQPVITQDSSDQSSQDAGHDKSQGEVEDVNVSADEEVVELKDITGRQLTCPGRRPMFGNINL